MSLKFNPFRPGSIAPVGMFSGRVDELSAIEKSLFQTKHGNPKHFLIEGERGIGKSSLMLFVKLAAEGGPSLTANVRFNFIVTPVELNSSTTYLDVIRSIASTLKSEMSKRQQLLANAKKAWDFLSNWKVLGVEYKKDQSKVEPAEALEDLANTLTSIVNDGSADIDGIVILIDEADKPSADASLGEFSKILTERLSMHQCEKVCLGLAGLPAVISKLKDSHESSVRLFEVLPLEPLKGDDVKIAVQLALDDAEKKNGFKTTITKNGMDRLIHFSEGYPHFIQQFGYCAFETDSDNIIDENDVEAGAFNQNGAIDQLGKKYFQGMYFDKVSSDDYRKVLNTMADHLDGWVSRSEIIRCSGVKETQINNALAALKSRNVILTNDEKKGEYRLPTKSFAVWIKALTSKEGE